MERHSRRGGVTERIEFGGVSRVLELARADPHDENGGIEVAVSLQKGR